MENIRKWIIIFIAVQFMAVGGFVIMASTVQMDSQSIVIGIISIFALDAFLIGFLLYQLLFKEKMLKKRLKASGASASATILSVQETSVSINNRPLLMLEVEIHDSIMGKFTKKLYRSMSFANPTLYKPGNKIPVLYNPNNIAEVVIDD